MTASSATRDFNRQIPKQVLFWGISLIIALSYCFLAFQADLRLSIPVLVGASALITVLLSMALYLGETAGIRLSPRVIIMGAIAFRLMFLFRPPELSDDIYRYLWDGLTTLHGNNPYALAPSDAKLLDVELLGHVNHSHLITIYPPAAQVFFAVGAFFGGILGIKSLLVAADIAVCAILMLILQHLKMPQSRALLYAWHPLPVLEIAASGHIDGAGIFFLMIAIALLIPRTNGAHRPFGRTVVAGVAFSFAALVKLFPLVFFPAFLFLAGKKGWRQFTLGAVIGAAILSVPFFPDIYNIFGTLDIYVRNWEFAGFAFRSLREMFPSGQLARQILGVTFLLFAVIFYVSLFRNRETHGKNGRITGLSPAAFRTVYYIALVFLLLTPTLHPWYALYLACLLPFAPGAAGLVMTWAVVLSYRVLIDFTLHGIWEESDAIPAVIFLSTVGAGLLGWVVRKHKPGVVTSLKSSGRSKPTVMRNTHPWR